MEQNPNRNKRSTHQRNGYTIDKDFLQIATNLKGKRGVQKKERKGIKKSNQKSNANGTEGKRKST